MGNGNKTQLAGSQFHGANLELLNPRMGKIKPLGVSGVAEFNGFSANYSAPPKNPLPLGAGVSVFVEKPATATNIQVQDFSIYKKQGVREMKGGNLYNNRSNHKSLKPFMTNKTR